MTALLNPGSGRVRQRRTQLKPVPGRRNRMATTPFVLVVALVMAVGMVGLLLLTTAVQDQAFAVQSKQREATALASRVSSLQAQAANARSVSNLAELAQRLGMRPNPYGAGITLDGRVVGRPSPVFGGEVPGIRYVPPPSTQTSPGPREGFTP